MAGELPSREVIDALHRAKFDADPVVTIRSRITEDRVDLHRDDARTIMWLLILCCLLFAGLIVAVIIAGRVLYTWAAGLP